MQRQIGRTTPHGIPPDDPSTFLLASRFSLLTSSVLHDVRHSLRQARRTPAFTLAAISALALGIGACTAIFTVVETVVLHPLPYPDPDRIVSISRPGGGSVPEPIFAYWERNNPAFDNLTAYRAATAMNLNAGGRPELVQAHAASRNYFDLFGARPILGRTFTSQDDSPGAPGVAVLSYGLWRRRFAGNPSILGNTVTLGGAPFTIAGVLSPAFKPYPPADLWIPLQADPNSTNLAAILTVAGRLPRGVSPAEAAARMSVIARRYSDAHSHGIRTDPNAQVAPIETQITGDIRPALLLLLGAVVLVLLIACANVANLLVARAAVRRREIAIRLAIGADGGRILRQLLAESLLLALGGGALGLLLGSWGVRALLALTPAELPRLQEMAAIPALDPRVAGFTFLLAVSTGLLFGIAPAFHLSRTELTEALNDSGRAGAGPTQARIRAALVAAEVAIAVVLLSGAGLLLRSFAAMQAVDLGFDPKNLLTMEISLAGAGYSNSGAVDRLARRVVERAERIPGVESAALASALPLWGRMDMIFDIPGRTPPGSRLFTGDVQWRFVTARYFNVLRVPLLAGRLLRELEPGRTVVISNAMARKFWPGANPVGQTIFVGPGLGPAYQVGLTQIVGVVGDVRERKDVDPQPAMYLAPSQIPDADMALLTGYERTAVLVRTRPGVSPMGVSRAVQDALLASANVPAAKIRTMQQAGVDSTARQNFNLLLLGLFAAIALLLAALGVYAVMSYTVEQRTREIGIRAALGASRRDTLRLVLHHALRMALAGLAAGIPAAFLLTRLLAAQLFGVSPSDPLTFAAVPLILLAVALAAACLPALRATRIDPLAALRHE